MPEQALFINVGDRVQYRQGKTLIVGVVQHVYGKSVAIATSRERLVTRPIVAVQKVE